MSEENKKFPIEKLMDDVESFRNSFNDVQGLQKNIINKIINNEYKIVNDAGEINADVINAISSLSNNVKIIYSALVDSYTKASKIYKELNTVKKDKPSDKKPIGNRQNLFS